METFRIARDVVGRRRSGWRVQLDDGDSIHRTSFDAREVFLRLHERTAAHEEQRREQPAYRAA
jgi:hypothetical protein